MSSKVSIKNIAVALVSSVLIFAVTAAFTILISTFFSPPGVNKPSHKIIMPAPKEFSLRDDVDFDSAEALKQFLRSQSAGAPSILHIESWGGLVVSYSKMLFYVKNAPGPVYCYVDSHAASSAALLLVNCDDMFVAPDAVVLFHVIQICTLADESGCLEMIPVSPTFRPELYERSIAELEKARPYLTERQWNQLLNSEDVIATGRQMMHLKKLHDEKIERMCRNVR